uniref:Uncharacterized protein n=1 Tax=Siphoviridae sp. ctBLh2 TaxID=2827803 RepID=A0A8S5S3N0_9CAUD|nr:MAG TPA: hypothetical protein [Siphoviridae sp. ctBLh2]
MILAGSSVGQRLSAGTAKNSACSVLICRHESLLLTSERFRYDGERF